MLLNALLEQPYSFTFADQSENESVILVVRAHPITQYRWVFAVTFFSIVPLFVGPILFTQGVNSGVIGFLILAWYALVFSIGLASYFLWYFNLGIVTTKKVVDVNTGSILYSESSSAFLKDIEEIKQSSQGVLSAAFNYGNILIQTAGEDPNIEFTQAPKTAFVVQTINELIERLPHSNNEPN